MKTEPADVLQEALLVCGRLVVRATAEDSVVHMYVEGVSPALLVDEDHRSLRRVEVRGPRDLLLHDVAP